VVSHPAIGCDHPQQPAGRANIWAASLPEV
jgi:hypothetical protein